jgi:GST-like protein
MCRQCRQIQRRIRNAMRDQQPKPWQLRQQLGIEMCLLPRRDHDLRLGQPCRRRSGFDPAVEGRVVLRRQVTPGHGLAGQILLVVDDGDVHSASVCSGPPRDNAGPAPEPGLERGAGGRIWRRGSRSRSMNDAPDYTPPPVWTWNKANGGKFASINRPISGPTHDKDLPVGRHPMQLYSMGTPNGVKVTVMLEELLAQGHQGAEYDAWLIRIGEGDQFGSGFVAVNPNSKIPALLDRSGPVPIRVFESGAILVHLAEKFGAFLPTEPAARAECLSWLFWQMGSAPYLGGGFGHFYAYAPTKMEYPIDRFAMEVKRQLDVLDRRLADSAYLAGPDYTIADIATWPWYGGLVKGWLYGAAEFLQVQDYRHVRRWADEIGERPAVQRGRMVNRVTGEPSSQLRERHDSIDFATRTQDKLAAD